MIYNKIEDLLPSYFQSMIEIKINENTKIKGRLILFTMKGFNFVLMIKVNETKIVKFILPRPFNCSKYSGRIHCDYRLKTLSDGDRDLLKSFKRIKIRNPSQFLGNEVDIIHINP